MLWNLSAIAAAVDGEVMGIDTQIFGISIDSRHIQKGDLFIPIKGENFDGHDYISAALNAGAVAFLSEKIIDDTAPYVLVKNSFEALEKLGMAARERTKATVIGITGSVGKTGFKTMLADLLSAYGKTHATIGNLNNHLGVPLTLARMPQDTQFAVIEMGMNHAGEIESLTKQAHPHHVIISAIAPAHIEFFSGLEAIAKAKAEIFSGAIAGGFAILPAGAAHLDILEKAAQKAGLNTALFGGQDSVEYKAGHMHLSADIDGEKIDCLLQGYGQPKVDTALGVLTLIKKLGLDLKPALAKLEALPALAGRGSIQKIGDFLILDDAYNANPISMKAGLETLALIPHSGRKWAVLGDMLELGKDTPRYHQELAPLIQKLPLAGVFLVGEHMASLRDVLPKDKLIGYAVSANEAQGQISKLIQKNDLILFKGSHGSGVWQLVEALKN